MINSMTGYGIKESEVSAFGKISAELKSSNHKFLDIVVHMPDSLLFLEDKIKKEIESRLRRARITCIINILGGIHGSSVFINKPLLKNYMSAIKDMASLLQIKDKPNIDTLIHLPGIMSLSEARIPRARLWPHLKTLINKALDDLIKTRQKEGRALCAHLKSRAATLDSTLKTVEKRFKKVIEEKSRQFKTDDERISFLKNTDISEEIERLAFHIKNFSQRLSKAGPIGKELDFIAQEMHREANTIGAKSCDAAISSYVVKIKSQIEKIREQAQNVE